MRIGIGARGACLPPALLLPLLAALAPEARAWDRETHVAILKTAIRISPAAEARMPADYRDTIFQNDENADPFDPACRDHPTLEPPRDPVAQAVQHFEQLSTGKGLDRPYNRAIAFGRFIHFVADCALPQAFLEHPDLNSELFLNRNFVVYRDPRPLKAPLPASLSERRQEAAWGDDSDSARTAAFRLAVNLVADALLLFPARPDAGAAPDAGPVVFVVDRLDTGRGGMRSTYSSSGTWYSREGGRLVQHEYSFDVRARDGSIGKPLRAVPGRIGFQILEWTSKRSGATQAVRALVLNNDDKCATHVVLSLKAWRQQLPIRLAPRGLMIVEFAAPADLDPNAITGTLDAYDCPAPHAPELGFPSQRRLVVGSTGHAPKIEANLKETAPENTSLKQFEKNAK